MKRFALFLVLVACVAAFACGRAEESPEPAFERIAPPAADIPSEPSRDPSHLPDLEALQLSIQAEPENVFVRFEYLAALDRLDMVDEAFEQARRLAAIEEDNPLRGLAYLNLAKMVLDDIPGDAPNRSELVEEAVGGLWIALGFEPESIPAHLALGRLSLEAGDYDTALHHLSIALSVTEIGYELRIRMAEIYIEREDNDKARAHLEAARRLAEEAEDRNAMRRIDRLLSRAR